MTDLREFDRFAQIIASERADPNRWDDARQEGLIAGWEASRREVTGSQRSYMIAACKNRIAGYLSGRAAYGAPSHQGKRMVEADLLHEDEEIPHTDTYDVEVRAVVASLPPEQRELVFRKFWLGEPFTRWDRPVFDAEIKPVLRELLAA